MVDALTVNARTAEPVMGPTDTMEDVPVIFADCTLLKLTVPASSVPHVMVVAARLALDMGPDTIKLLVITVLAGKPPPPPPPPPPTPLFAISFHALSVYSSMPPAPWPADNSVITPPGITVALLLDV